jgi:hypothetical protein
VSKLDAAIFSLAGLLAWLAATLFYAAFGGSLLEQAFWFYALNAFAAAAAVTFVFQATARLRRVSRVRLLYPAMAFGMPILAGADLVLVHFQKLISDEPISQGRYGAFMLVLLVSVGASVFERRAQKARI